MEQKRVAPNGRQGWGPDFQCGAKFGRDRGKLGGQRAHHLIIPTIINLLCHRQAGLRGISVA